MGSVGQFGLPDIAPSDKAIIEASEAYRKALINQKSGERGVAMPAAIEAAYRADKVVPNPFLDKE